MAWIRFAGFRGLAWPGLARLAASRRLSRARSRRVVPVACNAIPFSLIPFAFCFPPTRPSHALFFLSSVLSFFFLFLFSFLFFKHGIHTRTRERGIIRCADAADAAAETRFFSFASDADFVPIFLSFCPLLSIFFFFFFARDAERNTARYRRRLCCVIKRAAPPV